MSVWGLSFCEEMLMLGPKLEVDPSNRAGRNIAQLTGPDLSCIFSPKNKGHRLKIEYFQG